MSHPHYLHVRHPFQSEQALKDFSHRHNLHDFNLGATWCDASQEFMLFDQNHHGHRAPGGPVNQAAVVAGGSFKVALRACPVAGKQPKILVTLLAETKEPERIEERALDRIRAFYDHAAVHGRFAEESLANADPATARAIASPFFHALLGIGAKPCDVEVIFEGKLARGGCPP